MNLKDHILELKGIGEKSANLFRKLNIETLKDLVFYYPRDYETFVPCIKASEVNAPCLCALKLRIVDDCKIRKIRNLTILNVSGADDTGVVQLTFFNMAYLKNTLKRGTTYIFRGQVLPKGTNLVMEHPKMYKEDEYAQLLKGIWPKYPLTKGITNQAITKAVSQVLDVCPMPADPLPDFIRDKEGLLPLKEALWQIHFPSNREMLVKARKRLAFDDFFSVILQLRRSKELVEEKTSDFPMIEVSQCTRLMEQLPYQLTNAQQRAWQEICQDLSSGICMNRLIQGDVGSGKTVVAMLALLMCVSNGYQGSMMAPTEVLARQHYESFLSMTKKYNLPFKPVLLVGSMSAKDKREAYSQIASGQANVVLGTHAIIQDKVEFKNLALVITDEQHRFGVRQRETLAEKGMQPHVLVMSATPIPRTLAIILYGDLHISVIDELPGERLPIKNCVVGTNYRNTAYKFIASEVSKGRQAYVICPMVEEGEMEDLENVVDYAEKLKAALPPEINVAYLHGKMRPADKNQIMESFGAGHIHVLVSTTVIEVGINVPNATVMMVENAERFGLAQLHQLRGRVGRGAHQSYCIFVSAKTEEDTLKRLEILNKSNDGFFIAGEDLKMRGPGDLFGIRQSGAFSFKIGDIYNDSDMLKASSEWADVILQEDPLLSCEKYNCIKGYFDEDAFNFIDFKSI
ncbi:MAG: ATP-dependent DNA helicase RecG [Lachnospiraceae bacterium]|nr:ATP-dependent DNA helicase RecG [Lachnospiraceae bacterium]